MPTSKSKYASPEAYEESKKKWAQKHLLKPVADLKLVPYLYHSTQKVNLASIKLNGLLPKQPEWGGADASKDGYLSMATTRAGAGAMGGKSVLFRMAVKPDMSPWDFRGYSATEVRTTSKIEPTDLAWLDGVTWKALV